MLAVPLLAVGLLAAPPAAATPPAGRSAAVLLAASGDDSTSAGRPVSIAIGRLEPRTVTPGATITVTGFLTNVGSQPLTGLGIRLQRGEVRTTRAELDDAVKSPDPDTSVVPPFREIGGTLAPGAQLGFTYTLPAADLQLDTDGVYPALLNLNGMLPGGQQQRVGEVATFLVRQAVVPTAHTTVAWLWPVTERTHLRPAGGFADDTLTTSIGSGGRLDRVLGTLERLPRTLPAGGTEPVPSLPVTLAIDPALVEELTTMAAGPYGVAGVAGAGRGTEVAVAFLGRLRALAAVHPVVALAYGDVDADALEASGLADVLTRSLPGTASGTAQQHPAAAVPAPTAAPTTPASTTPGAPAPVPAAAQGAGARILAAALHVAPRTDLFWAAGSTLRTRTLATLQAGGVREVVLGSAGIADGSRAVGLLGGRAAAGTTVQTPAGPLGVLVADPVLGSVVGSAEHTPGGPRLAEQRYLAELAVLDQQARPGSSQTVLVAPPRAVDPSPEGAGAMMADTTGSPWLRPGSVAGLQAAVGTPAGKPSDRVDGGRLDAAGLTELGRAVAVRDDLAGAVQNPGLTLGAYDAAIARTASVAWRSDAVGFRTAADGLWGSLESLRARVTLLAPANGTYSLASSDAPLVLTVRNDLPFAVSVVLDLRIRGNRGLSIDHIGAQVLPQGQRTTLQVPAHVRQSGSFAVTAALTTPSGGMLGSLVEMQVKSTTYGSISLLITFGAAGLLGLLFLRRLVLFILRRRHAAAVPAPPVALEPPTRSPV
ncbi:MAG: hypothetical protein QOJ68_1821 [Blastococcus sp.]|nr:hypothetical protein [Blastococcus sp.]